MRGHDLHQNAARTGRALVLLAATCALGGCLQAEPAVDYGDPTSLTLPTTVDGITAFIASPDPRVALDAPAARVSIAAYTEDASPLTVTVRAEGGVARGLEPSGAPGPDQRFTGEVALRHGVNTLTFEIGSADGTRRRRLVTPLRYEGAAPGVRVDAIRDAACAEPITSTTASDAVCLVGRVTSPGDPATLIVSSAGGSDEATLEEDGTFSTTVTLSEDGAFTITATASNGAGASSDAVSVTRDSAAPRLEVDVVASASPAATEAAVTGRADDDGGAVTVTVTGPRGPRDVVVGPDGAFSATVALEPGANALTVRAVDAAGNAIERTLDAHRARAITLRGRGDEGARATLELDRDALATLFDEQAQRDLTLATVPLRPAILNALRAIRDPLSFRVDTSAWGQPERNLNRLLAMTPDTARLDGSSVEALLDVGAAIGLPSPRLIAQMLDIEVTAPFLSLDVLADVLLDGLVATHPRAELDANGAPVVTVTLYDALLDLAPLAQRFGPAGDHPGFLTGQTRAELLEPGFLMTLAARANLVQRDGVDASRGQKDYLFVAREGPALSFDFLDPDAFVVVGLADLPTLSMTIAVDEADVFVPAGSTQNAGADPERAGFFRGDGPVWSTPTTQLARVVAEAAYRQYHDRFAATNFARTLIYDAGAITDAATIDWSRGWLTLSTSGGVGDPPAPLYVWDMLLEVAQLRLHDGGIPQGDADVTFTLEDVPVGLDATTLVERLRPILQDQEEELATLIVGERGASSSGADLFFVPSTEPGADGFLFFRAPGDAPGQPYGWSLPGFFDPDTGARVSSTDPMAGTTDSTHEKVAATEGLSVAFTDDLGDVYVLTVTRGGDEPIVVVAPKEAP